MLGYLKEFNLNEEDIENIINSNDLNIIKNLELMKNNVKTIINYLYEIGVDDLRSIFEKRIDLFFLPLNLLKQNFTKLDKNMLIHILNNSISDLINYNI